MKVFNNYKEFNDFYKTLSSAGSEPNGTAIAIGNFDGCHIAHQLLLQKLLNHSKDNNLFSLGFSFNPHPLEYFRQQPINKLFTDVQKSRALAEMGLDGHLAQNFDNAIASMSAEDFFQQVLVEQLKAKLIVVGEDFRFGHQRKGDCQLLKQLTASQGISLLVVKAVEYDQVAVSSSRIRQAIGFAGNLALAKTLMGRPYMLEGHIDRGLQLGKTLGFPTANLHGCTQLLPLNGVYAGWVWLEGMHNRHREPPIMIDTQSLTTGELAQAVFNIGIRPTVSSSGSVSLEAHLLDTQAESGAFYQKRAAFYFLERLRPEQKFNTLEELIVQIKQDILKARSLF